MNNFHLKLDNVWHRYIASSNGIWSLKSIDLDIQPGELMGLLGPSGCGKTTLLRLIAGFERPDKGTIFLKGNKVAARDQFIQPERRGVGMVFQDYALFPHLNIWENIVFGLKRFHPNDRALWLVEILHLSKFLKRYPHELSGGQRQRVALARALSPGNSIVLLDEPFSSLDVDVRNKLRSDLPSVLNSCSASGILVTHDPEEALAICDRVSVMKNGEIEQCSTPAEIVKQPSTPFVARFVLQRNVLPLKLQGNILETPLGPIKSDIYFDSLDQFPTELMVDDNSLSINLNSKGKGIIKAKEFLGNGWIVKIVLNEYLIRVFVKFENDLNIGSKCDVNFVEGESCILFPGAIKIPLLST